MKVWAEGKSGVEKVKKRLLDRGLELCEYEPEIVLVWGGDGSVLRAARKHPNSCLLGLRVDSVGRLTELDGSCLDYAVERLASNDYKIEEAPMVELKYGDIRIHGLNEVYFSREYEHATRFRVFIDGVSPYEGVLFGDGCLAATPLGSTGYSWTAGRKILLKPGEKALVFTPLSSGYLDKRIVVDGVSTAKLVEQIKVSDENEVVVEILRGGKNKFAADGLEELKTYIDLDEGDEIIFKKSDEKTRFIRLFSECGQSI